MSETGDKRTPTVALRLPADIVERLDQLAKRTGHSRAWLMRLAVRAYIDDLEAKYGTQAIIDLDSPDPTVKP